MRSRRLLSLLILLMVASSPLLLTGSEARPVVAQGGEGAFHVFLILAIDQSGSMATNDEKGWRFDAAKFLVGALDAGDEVAIFTFASRTTSLVADSPPRVIGGSQDKLDLWRTLDARRYDRPQQATNMVDLFDTLDKYLGGLSSRAQTQTLLVLLTDGQDYPDDSCRAGASAAEVVKCSQHRQQAEAKGKSLNENALSRFQDDRLGKAFTFLPIALKGPAADYDLDFLAAVSGLTPDQIPQANSTALVQTFESQVIGRMLDRVAVPGVETERRGIFSFKIPEGARSLTFATTGTKNQISGQALPIWHPTPDKSVSAPASCNEVEGGCLAVVPDPEAGDWWVEQQGGEISPQAFLRFDLNLVATPAILPAGKPVSATVDLENQASGGSLLGAGFWSIAPRSLSAADVGLTTDQQKSEGVHLSNPIDVKKGDADYSWSLDLLAWPGLLDRSSLDPLQDEYRLASGDTVPLVVAGRIPPDPKFQMGEVFASVGIGNQTKDIVLQPDSGGRYTANLDALSLLGEGQDQGTMSITYGVRGARYEGFTYPADWWQVQESKTPTIVRVRNRVTVEPGTINLGWLRRRDVTTQVPVTLRCDQCEQGTKIPLSLEVAKWQVPGKSDLAIDPLAVALREPLLPGEQQEMSLDLSHIVSRLPEAQVTGYGSFNVGGARVPVDFKPSQLTIQADNRTELQRLWGDEKLWTSSVGLLGVTWAFYEWEAQYLWIVAPALLCLVSLALALSLFIRQRRWLLWAPLALVGGGMALLFALAGIGLVRGVAHFSYNLEWGYGEAPPERIRTAGVAPLDFTLSNDPAAQSYQPLPSTFPLVYARLSQAGEAVDLAGLRGTQIREEGAATPAERVRMLPGKRYYLLSPGAASSSGAEFAKEDWGLSPGVRTDWGSLSSSSQGTSRKEETEAENMLWLRLMPEGVSSSEESTETDLFTDYGNF